MMCFVWWLKFDHLELRKQTKNLAVKRGLSGQSAFYLFLGLLMGSLLPAPTAELSGVEIEK